MRAVILLIAFCVMAATVEANFAAAPGFSGRVADCTSCHRPPVEGDNAEVIVDGIPEAWDVGTAYDWVVRVEGGPQTLPDGPQAGFEMEVLDGTFQPGPDATHDVRGFHDRQSTYTETGVFQRSWSVTWQAPDLAAMPSPIQVWVAGMAANGNHNVMLNVSDAGEHGDSVHNRSYVIPPSAAAVDAWRALPLAPPAIDRIDEDGGQHVLHGRLVDGNATSIQVFDGTQWQDRPSAPSWRLRVDLESVLLRSAGSDRVSPVILVDLADGTTMIADGAAPAEATPAPIAIVPILLAALIRRNP